MSRRAGIVGAVALALSLAGCGETRPSDKTRPVSLDGRATPAQRPARRHAARRRKTVLPLSRRYANLNYRLHRPYHRLRFARYVYNDEIGEDIVGLRTPYARVTAAFGPPRTVPAADRHDRQGHLCIYYGVVSPHGEVSRSEWQFCFKRGRMYSAVDGQLRDHRPSAGP